MHLSALHWLLVLGIVGLQAAILVLMVRRGFRSTFPFFFNLLAFSLVRMLVEMGIVVYWYSPPVYFYVYWVGMATEALLVFAVIFEVFVHVLKPYSALVDLGKLLFRWAVLFLALASVLTALVSSGSGASKICSFIEVLDRSCGLMQCGLLLLFLLFERRLSLSWRSPAICIMVGLGFTASIGLATSFLLSRIPSWTTAMDLVQATASLAISGAWYACFALPQPARRTAQDSPTKLILQRWNEAVMASPLMGRRAEITAFSAVESFLPGVERTVERIMAQKMH